MKKIVLSVLLVALAMTLFAQGSTESVSAYEVSKVSEPKYVFMFIFSSSEINLADGSARHYAQQADQPCSFAYRH